VEVVFFHGIKLGLAICEDIWNGPGPFYRRLYPRDPLQHLVSQGAQLIITISASPFTLGKDELRYRLLQQHARKAHLPFVYVNQVGGNDELVFDGKSFCVDREGSPIVVLPGFQEDVHTVETELPGTPGSYPLQEATESIYQALVTGIRDYARKCGFQRVILGLSGGLDSAVTCCLAAAALGPEQVLALAMPSPYTSTSSTRDAQTLAANLGTELKEISISRTLAAYLRSLKPHFAGTEPDVTEENLQARIRGTLLMGFSNKFGHLVLATGNKSELAMGYCTLYGDMVGGLAPLADVPKTTVYDLAHYINRNGKVVPESIIRKPPSAELKPNQTDQDSLPPYEILDGILHYYVEKQLSQQEIVARGFDPETVRFVVQTVNRNEYKRRQAAPAIKVTSKAFGPGRRIPLAAKWE